MKRLALVVPVALLAAACGGGASKGQSSGLSKSDYVQKAEAICAKANSDQKALTLPTSQKALPAYVQQILDLATKATSDLEALQPPSADKQDIETKVLTPLKGQLALGRTYLQQVKEAVAKNDQAALTRLVSSPPTGSKADLAWMRSYGFKACVQAADTSG